MSVVDGVEPGSRRHRMRVTVATSLRGVRVWKRSWGGKAPVEMGEIQRDEMSARKERQEMDGASRVRCGRREVTKVGRMLELDDGSGQ